jgi:hypothetical protein
LPRPPFGGLPVFGGGFDKLNFRKSSALFAPAAFLSLFNRSLSFLAARLDSAAVK